MSASWRAAQYRFSWQYIATRHGLAAHSYTGGRDDERPTKPEVAKLTKIKATPGMDRLRVKLPTGLNTTHVEKACDGLAHAFRVREVRIAPDKPGWVWVELHRRDVLAPALRPLPIEQVVDLGAVPIGQHEDGSLWRFRLQGTHVLIAGATGSGKGSVLWSLLRGIAVRITDGSVQVWAVDPKGGMELGPGRPLFTRFEDRDPDAMCALVEDLVAVKDTRARDLAARGLRKHVPSPESPHLLLLVDELATLTAFADRKVTNRIDQALGLLLTQGRACGITVLAAVQDPGKDVVGWRDLFRPGSRCAWTTRSRSTWSSAMEPATEEPAPTRSPSSPASPTSASKAPATCAGPRHLPDRRRHHRPRRHPPRTPAGRPGRPRG